jgi:GNAT superfamily N-acetyltransferase
MTIEIRQEPIAALPAYAGIPIAFEVTEIFEVAESHDGQVTLTAHRVAVPYMKDYDAVDGESPLQWPGRLDVSKWAFFSAFVDGTRVGGAAVARDTAGLDMLEGRRDLAVLWDIRVAPSHRRRGVGAALFEAAVSWAAAAGCDQLKVETQNINVAACRFYARNGCTLRAARRGVYPRFADEIQLLWYASIS